MIKVFANLHLWILIINCFLLIGYKNVNSAVVDENQLKVAYLIHLSEFTTWPEEKMQQLVSFNICIASESQLKEPLDQIKGREVKNKQLEILYDIPVEKLNNCHIFYVEDKLNKKVFQQNPQKNAPILTVSSDAEFTKEGGVVEYYREGDKIRMRVNLKMMSQSKLIISSKLLRLMDSSF
jgi:hypothetical protein